MYELASESSTVIGGARHYIPALPHPNRNVGSKALRQRASRWNTRRLLPRRLLANSGARPERKGQMEMKREEGRRWSGTEGFSALFLACLFHRMPWGPTGARRHTLARSTHTRSSLSSALQPCAPLYSRPSYLSSLLVSRAN